MEDPEKRPPPPMTDCPEVSGLFEVCLGVASSEELALGLHYWRQFGFYEAATPRGHLPRDKCRQLYDVDSQLHSVRLFHGSSDHGLLRLMYFSDLEERSSPSSQLTNLRAVGARWGAHLTEDVFNIHHHALEAQEGGFDVRCCDPLRCVVYKSAGVEKSAQPFTGTIACVREMLVIQPGAVSNFFQRYDYTIPNYGTVDPKSKFKASQVTHCGLIVQGEEGVLGFYEKVLGLIKLPVHRVDFDPNTRDATVKAIIGLEKPGEYYVHHNFDDPRSSTNVPDYRSGRLHVVRFPLGVELPDLRRETRPGCLGPCLYTLRSSSIEAVQARVTAAEGVSEVTAGCLENEFGELSFTFVSPDGYMWNMVQARE